MEKNNTKVSVILPVHNAGNYLSKCLDSLVHQTLNDIEIIVILDCPTDGSDIIVQEYAKKYEQITIINNEQNQHIGESRNKGLTIAKGKYIGFCDHDDECDLRMFESLYNSAEQSNSDVVISNYVSNTPEGKIKECIEYPCFQPKECATRTFETCIGIIDENDPMRIFPIHSVIWNKLFKTSLVKEHNIHFVDTKKCMAEDLLFLMEYSFYSSKMSIIYENLYFHMQGEMNTGLGLSYYKPEKIIFMLDYIYNFLLKNNIYEKYKLRFYNNVCVSCHRSLARILHSHKGFDFFKAVKIFKTSSIVRQAFKEVSNPVFPRKPGRNKIRLFKIEQLLIGGKK